jgi:hypothetical protein
MGKNPGHTKPMQLEALATGSDGVEEGSDSGGELGGSGDVRDMVIGQMSDESSDEGEPETENKVLLQCPSIIFFNLHAIHR